MRLLLLAALCLFTGTALGQGTPSPPAAAPAAPVKATKRSDEPTGNAGYATVELRHHMNTYYSTDGFYERQEPSVHARFQVGAKLYSGLLDVYATLGAYKMPGTQQVLQRRPEIGIDLRPIRHENFELLQYTLIQLPYRETKPDPETQEGGEMGTVVLLGVAPLIRMPIAGAGARWEPKLGGDLWTRLFSRRQYTGDYRQDGQGYDEDEEGHLSLTDGTVQEPIEDTALHYRSLVTTGVTMSPLALPELATELTANHFSKFEPRYTLDDEQRVTQDYAAERYSYVRWRLQFQLSERWSMTNEFYAFYDDAFQGKRTGPVDRRYRNVARVTCRM